MRRGIAQPRKSSVGGGNEVPMRESPREVGVGCRNSGTLVLFCIFVVFLFGVPVCVAVVTTVRRVLVIRDAQFGGSTGFFGRWRCSLPEWNCRTGLVGNSGSSDRYISRRLGEYQLTSGISLGVDSRQGLRFLIGANKFPHLTN